MAKNNLDWEDLGRGIQDAVDRAINSQDYHKLNQTIRQTVEKAMDMGGEALRRAVEPAPQKPAPVKPKELYAKTGGKRALAIVKTSLGGIFGVLFFAALLSALTLTMPVLKAFALGLTVMGLTGCGWLIGSGVGTLKQLGRFRTYRQVLGEKTSCSLEKLARRVGKTVKFVRRDVWKMIRKGYFLEGHMDKEETHLITSEETYRQFEQSRIQLEQRQREAKRLEKPSAQTAVPTAQENKSEVEEVLRRGNAFITEIRRCNDAIPGEEISRKISRMELIVQRIFLRAQAHPEIVPDLKKMMDYYLPMTVKLLNAYADMDAQPVQGETIQSSKREIEEALDTLNLAFEKLLDSVFQDTALDVSSDISVLQTMLAQEGLVDDELARMKKQQNP